MRDSVPTALVVEDDPNWLGILRDELLSAGFKVDWAGKHEEALRKVAEPPFEYDIVFLDPNLDDSLGGLSGMAIAERLAARQSEAGIVLISGFASPGLLASEYAAVDVTVHGIFEKAGFDLGGFRELVLELRGVDRASEALFRCDRVSLAESWERAIAADTNSEKGGALEDFAIELLSGISLLKLFDKRVRTQTSEIDAVFRVKALAGTLCQEWGGLLLVECRNRAKRFDAKAVRDFAQKLNDGDAKVGIVVTAEGVTGRSGRDAQGAIGNVFQQQRRVILVIDSADIVGILEHDENLYEMLIERDMAVRLGK